MLNYHLTHTRTHTHAHTPYVVLGHLLTLSSQQWSFTSAHWVSLLGADSNENRKHVITAALALISDLSAGVSHVLIVSAFPSLLPGDGYIMYVGELTQLSWQPYDFVVFAVPLLMFQMFQNDTVMSSYVSLCTTLMQSVWLRNQMHSRALMKKQIIAKHVFIFFFLFFTWFNVVVYVVWRWI